MEGQSPYRDIFNRPNLAIAQKDHEVKSPGPDVAKYRGKILPDLVGPMPEYVPLYAPYDPSAEHVNFTTTFNERYVGNQATGNVYG